MNFKVNINDEVKVKLTETGINVLRERRNELNKMIEARGGKGYGEFELKTDEQGYMNFQLWDLMNTFGDLLTIGFQVPFETEIIVTKGEPLSE